MRRLRGARHCCIGRSSRRDVAVAVQARSDARITPERAAIHVSVRADGPVRAAVVERAMALAEPVRGSITDREEAGSHRGLVEQAPGGPAPNALERPGQAGLRPCLLREHRLHRDVRRRHPELSIWASEISPWDGVDVGWVNWHLTPQTRADIEREVASAAVGVAVQRAQAYAAALGLNSVTPVEIADTGLISRETTSTPQTMKTRGAAFAASADAGPVMEYEPDDIVVSATVEARFTAR